MISEFACLRGFTWRWLLLRSCAVEAQDEAYEAQARDGHFPFDFFLQFNSIQFNSIQFNSNSNSTLIQFNSNSVAQCFANPVALALGFVTSLDHFETHFRIIQPNNSSLIRLINDRYYRMRIPNTKQRH